MVEPLGPRDAAGARLRNEVAAGGFAERAGGNGLVPNAGTGGVLRDRPENLYQFEQWRLPLEHLAEQRPVFVIVDRPDTGDRCSAAAASRLPSPAAARRSRSWSLSVTSGWCST